MGVAYGNLQMVSTCNAMSRATSDEEHYTKESEQKSE